MGAGHETTANLLTWTLYELAKPANVGALRKLQAEIDTQLPHLQQPTTPEQLTPCTYLDCVLQVRGDLIGRLKPCMTEMYLHIVARMDDYIDTDPYRKPSAATQSYRKSIAVGWGEAPLPSAVEGFRPGLSSF